MTPPVFRITQPLKSWKEFHYPNIHTHTHPTPHNISFMSIYLVKSDLPPTNSFWLLHFSYKSLSGMATSEKCESLPVVPLQMLKKSESSTKMLCSWTLGDILANILMLSVLWGMVNSHPVISKKFIFNECWQFSISLHNCIPGYLSRMTVIQKKHWK